MQKIKVALAQIAPVWFNREATLDKVNQFVQDAANEGCKLIAFGEAFVPGYPFWIERTDGARFNDERQKNIQAEYIKQAVQIERGDLSQLCETAKQNEISIYLGIIERPKDRSGHSLYCSLVYIDQNGIIQSVHRKLMPTYEERLSWSIGDGHGLVTHSLEDFTVGGLNCWENWMPLARASLYGQGEDLHVAVWPGNINNTHDLTPVIAKEGRSFVLSVCSLMRPSDITNAIPELAELADSDESFFANGGSCIANPDGTWLIEPKVETEELLIAELDHQIVRKERQNFDPAGHYSRPDVTRLEINRTRQSTISIKD
ncbi:carbon-nitrogen hydrolase family protein [Aliikangiella coralliicola]|uniref:Carbon-nitrogen hydrolase family protein n=1 Tax=Aliikangiella coralliicola TaxID=2592383 RepID=A0A545UHU5_9GAMM|nr:carbon-nitrogen hydrolase family protein [Aliikangiella coralliicola]TQV88983.1 carbon-nitrogen hydrolase family protein [Aliikangiella coralliicola]